MPEETNQQPTEQASPVKTKKPIYKKWWFWLLLVLLLAAIAGGGSSGSSDKKTDSSASSNSTIQSESVDTNDSTEQAAPDASNDQESSSESNADDSGETVIPEVVGMALNDADSQLEDFNATYIKGDGSEADIWLKSNWRIDAIDPAAGTTVQKGSDITLTVTNTTEEEREAKQAEQAAQEAEARASIEYIDITASQLIADLEANAMVAKENYVGGNYRITGVVSNIDASGKYIDISPDDNPWSFTPIQCYVRYDDTADAIRQLSKDQYVSVCGEITEVGELLGYSVDINRIEF